MDIVHKIGIKAPIPSVYQALSTVPGLAGWWTTDTTGESAVGGRIRFWFSNPNGGERGGFVMEVLELARDSLVRWRVVDGPAEWVGTDIDFTLAQSGEYAISLLRYWISLGASATTLRALRGIAIKSLVLRQTKARREGAQGGRRGVGRRASLRRVAALKLDANLLGGLSLSPRTGQSARNERTAFLIRPLRGC